MKFNVIAVLSLSFLLVHIHFSLAKRKIKIRDKIDMLKKKILDRKPKFKQPKETNQGRLGGYPKQGYHQYPGYPAGGYPAQGSPYRGGYGGYGGYPGGYMNYNPNNKILSPHYGGSFGYGGYGVGGGSPFSHQVQSMGMYPSDKSRGYGRSAVMAAAGGAMAGMALGYGLGRFPRPHFSFHSPQEEYYYNHYMYRKYGVKSTDTNDYSRDYTYTQAPVTYDDFMRSCMRRQDLLPAENRKSNRKLVATIPTKSTTATAAPHAGPGSSSTTTNGTAAQTPSALPPANETNANTVPPTSQTLRKAAATDDGDDDDDDDDDTVSIVEIGYPALIRDLKVRRCVELYMAYSEKYLKRQTEAGGAQRRELGLGGLLAVLTSAALMLLNSNIVILQC